ncbi:hypothetical protein MTO96_020604 [Rhipicephalus appendiculatus]
MWDAKTAECGITSAGPLHRVIAAVGKIETSADFHTNTEPVPARAPGLRVGVPVAARPLRVRRSLYGGRAKALVICLHAERRVAGRAQGVAWVSGPSRLVSVTTWSPPSDCRLQRRDRQRALI